MYIFLISCIIFNFFDASAISDEFFEAAEQGKTERLERLWHDELEKYSPSQPDLNQIRSTEKHPQLHTLLSLAASRGHLHTVKWLIDHGSQFYVYAATEAVKVNHGECALYLFEKGSEILSKKCALGKEVVRWWLQALLARAAFSGYTHTLKCFTHHINTINLSESTPLFTADIGNDTRHGSLQTNDDGVTVEYNIYDACFLLPAMECAEFLKERCASIITLRTNYETTTAASAALRVNKREAVQFLQKYTDCFESITSDYDAIPPLYSILADYVPVEIRQNGQQFLQLVLAKSRNNSINRAGPEGTPLEFAITHNRLFAVEPFLEHGASPESLGKQLINYTYGKYENVTSYSLLHHYAGSGESDKLRALLKFKANPDTQECTFEK